MSVGAAILCILSLCVGPNEPLAEEGSQSSSWLTNLPLTGCLKLSPQGKECAEPVVYTEPQVLSWQGLIERFPLAKRIPPALPEDLRYHTGSVSKKETTTIDICSHVLEWLALDFRGPQFGSVEPWAQSVGNLLEAFSKYDRTLSAKKAALDTLKATYPKIWDATKDFLPEWVLDDFLYSSAWDPYKTESTDNAQNDGILERPPLLMRAGASRPGFETPSQNRKIFQASAPIYASMATIITAENDFGSYPHQVGSNYQEVYPLKGTYFAGVDPLGKPFTVYDVSFTQKPFFLATLRFVLRQFIHYEDNRLVMENILLEGDMKYLRLKIYYDPIRTTDGRTIGHVKTELIDVDVKTLPMGDKDRSAAVRGDVGNIKRAAEALSPTAR